MASANVKITGVKALDKKLMMLTDQSARRVLRPAMKAGADLAKRKAKQLVPVRTGQLKADIKSKSYAAGKDKVIAKIFILNRGEGLGRGDGDYKPSKIAHLVEFGTSHSKAYPFMRPAVENNASQILAIVAAKTQKELVKQVDKLKYLGDK